MRFLVLLLFGGMGVALLYLSWTFYETATIQVNTWPQLDGVVQRVDEDGYAVQYQVNSETYVAPASRWLGWPWVKDGDKLRVVYNPGSPASGRVNAWQETYQDAVLILLFASIGLFLGIGGFWSFGGAVDRTQDLMTGQEIAVPGDEESEVSFILGEVVELRHPTGNVVLTCVGSLVAFLMSMALFRSPDILFTRWLSWPAAVVAFAAGVLILLAAYDLKRTVLRADTNGLRHESRWKPKAALWTQIEQVARVRQTHREYSQTLKRYRTRTVGYTWVLSDRNGTELIRIDEDLQPQDALRRLLRYVRGRTGLTVEERTE